jgi:transposase
MPWKTMDVKEQRVKFVVAASRREKAFSGLRLEFGISRPTGQLWLQRYREAGVAGIAERSRRPQHSPRQTPCCRTEHLRRQRLCGIHLRTSKRQYA